MSRSFARPALTEVLVSQGVLSRHKVEDTLCRVKGVPAALGKALVEDGLLTEAQLAQALADQHGLRYDPLTNVRVDPQYYESISIKWMQRVPFVPLSEQAGVLTIAVAEPQNLLGLDELELLIGKPLELVVSSRSAIMAALERSEGSSQILREFEAGLSIGLGQGR
ncbi:MAG: hypothetical protein U0223_09155 [Nitrospira sp.]